MNFTGKVALVTGSTTGIGEACARPFAGAGCTVMVSGRDAARGGSNFSVDGGNDATAGPYP